MTEEKVFELLQGTWYNHTANEKIEISNKNCIFYPFKGSTTQGIIFIKENAEHKKWQIIESGYWYNTFIKEISDQVLVIERFNYIDVNNPESNPIDTLVYHRH